ncbi:MAG: GFA family protein [Sphingomonas sp.]|nr:GFA family protein [Sphingomonas sp.]
MLKTYQGSCHCGAVRYEADIDLEEGTGRCNCSVCAKRRFWGTTVRPEQFRLLDGEQDLGDYQFNTNSVHHRFCRTCGTPTFGHGFIEEVGGAFYSVSLATLDAPESELAEAPIKYMDGANNNWWSPPAEVRHL